MKLIKTYRKFNPVRHAQVIRRNGTEEIFRERPVWTWLLRLRRKIAKLLTLLLMGVAVSAQAQSHGSTMLDTPTIQHFILEGGTLTIADVTGSIVNLASGTVVRIATGTNNIGTVSGSTITVSAILGTVTVTPSTQTFSVNQLSHHRADTYAAVGSGFIVNVSSSPLRTFSIQVNGIGASATTWDVRLEGSLDGVNFTELLKHTEIIGDKIVLYSGTTLAPTMFFRSRVEALVLGGASAINVIILGIQ